jgi:asparagine synthase (glutamine-hydrolysing)
MQKLSGIFGSKDVTDIYDVLMTHWRKGSILNIATSDAALYPAAALEGADIPDIQRIMASDILGYLCSDILVKVDRAAMAASLETRIPLLDHRIVSFAQTLPLSLKVSAGEGKPVLKQLLGRYIPRELYERPKSGFAVPVAEWLRTDLRDWASDMLSPHSLREMPFLDADLVSKGWNRHLERKSDWSTQLWDVLMFIQWYRRYSSGITID